MKLEIGNKIYWECALGYLIGKVDNIVLDLNADNKMVPWLVIKMQGTKSKMRLCATESNLKMMKVKVI